MAGSSASAAARPRSAVVARPGAGRALAGLIVAGWLVAGWLVARWLVAGWLVACECPVAADARLACPVGVGAAVDVAGECPVAADARLACPVGVGAAVDVAGECPVAAGVVVARLAAEKFVIVCVPLEPW